MKKIYLIRHGQTEWNVQKKAQGAEADIPLNDTGRNESMITGKYLKEHRIKNKKFDVIFCSPMKRAYETAEIIQNQLNMDNMNNMDNMDNKNNVEIKVLDDLRENKSGLFSGTTNEERMEDSKFNDYNNHIKIYDEMKDPIEKVNYDKFIDEAVKKLGNETLQESLDRCEKVIKQIVSSNLYQKIIVVSHNGTLSGILKYITNSFEPCYGDLTNGSNCYISYIKYLNGQFKVMTNPNTIHLSLYKQ